ncbi:serine/threonine-protein kinase [Brachybacterium sacelli]|uniref:non-specific serine/threonine protein kinase n=1 Tax=Brachybacterium sacelli TaxID=173364 RepID=A0ABS4X1E0_9MICO|nr:serine/threonine-protein kinase [Brachybacterium sacelli]MBP2382279.1 serine/threonine-protein kinase [Brachybacterium sacelli]
MTTIMSDVIAGRIELLDPLARGASGSLWRAIDRRYGAVCAAKVMRQRDGAEVLRFVREQTVGSAQGLGAHPHLLPPYTWVAEDDTIVLVMPLVHGGTLAGALADHGALSPSLVAQLLRQLLDALAAMHASRWFHRDVKPANLLLEVTGEDSPHLLLADFGIALHESDVRLTETGFVHGTPGFMAPEILEGLGTSAAQDVWAAAACALEALAPLPPRERLEPAQLPRRVSEVLTGGADPAMGPLGELLQAMLEADPAGRPTAAEARDRIPPPTAPASAWARTADGRAFEVPDRVEATDALPQVPLDGPASLTGLAPGLHERLTALSRSASSPTERAVPDPPASQPARRTGGTWIGVLLLLIALLCLAGAAALLWAALA